MIRILLHLQNLGRNSKHALKEIETKSVVAFFGSVVNRLENMPNDKNRQIAQ